MGRKLTVLLLFVYCFSLVTLFGQQQDVFAPFISRLKIIADESIVKLTWSDSEDIEGTYEIYRHTEEITEQNFPQAEKVGEVEEGVEYFIDKPVEKGTYYYVVLAKQKNKLFKLFIPFRNKSVNGIAVKKSKEIEAIAATVTTIHTEIKEDSVIISFETDTPGRDLIIYRHTEPLLDRSDIIKATPLQIIPSSQTSFRDFPVPGISYYYGIIDIELVKVDKIDFTLRENATTIPARLSLGTRTGLPKTTLRRSLPLPLYPLPMEVETGNKFGPLNILIPEKTEELNPATSKAVAATLKTITVVSAPEQIPVILEADQPEVESGGEEYTLKSIIDSYFAEKKWQETERQLKDFLSTHHSEQLERRAHFYLGQTRYFLKKYRDAFMEFLLVKEEFYSQTAPWFDAIFRKLRS